MGFNQSGMIVIYDLHLRSVRDYISVELFTFSLLRTICYSMHGSWSISYRSTDASPEVGQLTTPETTRYMIGYTVRGTLLFYAGGSGKAFQAENVFLSDESLLMIT